MNLLTSCDRLLVFHVCLTFTHLSDWRTQSLPKHNLQRSGRPFFLVFGQKPLSLMFLCDDAV